MKLIQMIFGILFTISPLFTSVCLAQNENLPKNYIGFQITQVYFGEYQLSYERMLTKRISLELTGSKQPIKNTCSVREPGLYGSSYTDGIFHYEALKWTDFNKSKMIELACKYFINKQIYISIAGYYRECKAIHSQWHYQTPKTSDNEYWIEADIDSFIKGLRAILGKRWVHKFDDRVGLYVEPYGGLGYRYTKGNIFYYKFEEKLTPANNRYNFGATKNYDGVTIHLGAKIGIAFL